MKITAEPRSDQINADDFVGSAQTYTISGARQGTAEQKYDFSLAEVPGRVWRPPLTVLRLLIEAWGDESDNWVGRRVTLFRDSSVSFGRDAVGGIRISHMSDLPDNKPLKVKLTTKRGKRELFTVQPLAEAPAPTPTPEPTAEQVAACDDLNVLRAMHDAAGPEMRALILARRDEITGGESA